MQTKMGWVVGLMLGIGCAVGMAAEKASEIDGKWKAIALEKGGQALPAEALKAIPEETEFAEGKMRRIVMGKVTFEADFVLDPKATPKGYEMRGGKDRKGREVVIRGIYEVDKSGNLRICFSSGPDGKPPKSFDTKENPGSQLTVYERVK